VYIRRVVTGAKGTITFVITINLVSGGQPWKITSGTGAYAKLHGRGYQVVDHYQDTPATFVLKGTVSPAQA
jgi:predicted GNAT superfamily acetyltransferase